MSELINKSIAELANLLASGDVTSAEITRSYIDQIKTQDESLHAFLYLDADGALAQAEENDRARTAGRPASLLSGIPIAIKDVITTAGMPTTCGSRILENFRPPFDATAVKRLKEAGAIILGKTNTDEFAMGSSTENSAYGPTLNPWDPTRVPGGSSGGSAAAVAARLSIAALGSDTGGSVRQPASFCGVTGLKPTYGRVSRYGLIAYGSSLDCIGTLTRSAADAAVVFTTIAGQDPLDATSSDKPITPITFDDSNSLTGLRVGVPQEYFIEGIQTEVEQAVRKAIDTLKALGAKVVPVSLPHTQYAVPVYYLVAPAEASANLARFEGIRYGPRSEADSMWEVFSKTRGEHFGAEVKRRIMLGTYALSAGYYDAYYGQAQKVRTLIRQDFDEAFQQVDVIAAPVAPTTAFKFGAHTNDPLAMYLEDVFTLPANLAGVPGISFPVGSDSSGMPIGMQLMGRHFEEKLLLKTVNTFQGATDWHNQQPQV